MTPKTLRLIRQIHLYFGVFISPAILFFAVTGALQTFSLHETTPGSSYKPSLFIQTLGQIHKKQTWMLPPPRQRPGEKPSEGGHKDEAMGGALAPPSGAARAPESAAPGRSPEPARPKEGSHLPLKIFFLIVSIGLFTSTLTGITMAYKYERGKLLVTLLLLAGAVIPMLLLPF